MKREPVRTLLVDIDKWENETLEMKVMVFSTLFLVFYDLKRKKGMENPSEVKKFLEEVYDYYCNLFEKPVLYVRKGKAYLLKKEKDEVKIEEIKEGDEKWHKLLPL